MHHNGCVDIQVFRYNILEISFKDMNYYVYQICNEVLYTKKIFPHSTFSPQLCLQLPGLRFIL